MRYWFESGVSSRNFPLVTLEGWPSHVLVSRSYLALCDELLYFSCPHVLNAAFQGGNIDRSIPDHSGM